MFLVIKFIYFFKGQLEEVHSFGTAYQGEYVMKEEEPRQRLRVKRQLIAKQIEAKSMKTERIKANSITADSIVSDTVITGNIDVRSNKNKLVERRSFEDAQGNQMTRTRSKTSRRSRDKAPELNGNIGIDPNQFADGNFQLSSNDKMKSLQPLTSRRGSRKGNQATSSTRSRKERKRKSRRRLPKTYTEPLDKNKGTSSSFQLSSNDKLTSLIMQPLPPERDSRIREQSTFSTRSRNNGKKRRRPPQTHTQTYTEPLDNNKGTSSSFQLSSNDKLTSLIMQPSPPERDSRIREQSTFSTRSSNNGKKRKRPPQTHTQTYTEPLDKNKGTSSSFQLSSNDKLTSLIMQPLPPERDSRIREQSTFSTRSSNNGKKSRRPPQTHTESFGNDEIEHANSNFQASPNRKSESVLLPPLRTQQDSTVNKQQITSSSSKTARKRRLPQTFTDGKNNHEQNRFQETDVTGRSSSFIRNSGRHSRRKSGRKSRLNRVLSENLSGNPSRNNDRQPSYRTVDALASGDIFVNPKRSKQPRYRPTDPPLDFVEQDEFTKQSTDGLLQAKSISAGSINTFHMRADKVKADRIKSESIDANSLTVQPKHSVNLALYESKPGKQTNKFIKPKSPTYERANPISNARPVKSTMQASQFLRKRYEKGIGSQRLNIDRHHTTPESLMSLDMLGIKHTGEFAPKLKMFIEPTVKKEKIRSLYRKKNFNSNLANLRRSYPTEYVGDNYKSFHKYSNAYNDAFMF
ncbi:Hypothetical predicted protein [Mytilus galloprovincialis]|uniref:Uncharacterized protein n=1 Tax=Mytilus galloprovincialis TaxID=29158 RepID=A0A8B6D156_MYTGA|nr:Hypothetical predicted protein [Mytilus galloprovincialis]